jgi:putative ABC transport system substrate-binding protein
MNRRDAAFALLALGAAQLPAKAQQPDKVWRIGVLRPGPDDAIWRENFAPFRQAMRELGFVEGSNLIIEYRVRPGKPEEILKLATELVDAKVDAILAIAPPGVIAAARATRSIPIVANDMESDPIAQKFVTSLARPGGNVTGLFLDFPEMGGKWLQLLKEAQPRLSRIAVLRDPATGLSLLKSVEAAATSLRVHVFDVEARGPGELASAVQEAAKQKTEALLVLASPVIYSARKEIAALALQHRLPSIMIFPGFADDGGLMAYGPNLLSMFRQNAVFVAKVLRGTPPSEIPIERPARFEFTINNKTAKALGIKIPQAMLVRADRVIE